MLKNKRLLGNLDLFEELDDRLSEKISGGASVELKATFDKFEELTQLGLLQPNLLTRIQEKIAERFSEVGANLALGCTSTYSGIYNCEVSTKGETKAFVIDMSKDLH